MNVIIFGGPTVSKREVTEIIGDAHYMPPVKHAQVLSAVHNDKPDVIGIIDGIIGTELSVWHKEILFALDNGVRVYGAGSMGAIRAAELEKFGMVGVGQVFESYKNGRLQDDDEVFVKFEQENERFVRLSEPMVNIRDTFEKALRDRIIDETAFKTLVEIAKSIYYTERTFEKIFEKAARAGIDQRLLNDLRHFASQYPGDLLKQDALAMLEQIAALTPADIAPGKKDTSPYSLLFAPLYDRDRLVRFEDVEFPLYYIGNYLCLYHPDAENLNYHGLNRELALYLAELMQIKAEEEDIENEMTRFKKKYHLEDDREFKRWVEQNDLPGNDLRRLFEKQALVRKLHQWFFSCRKQLEKNTAYLLEELKLNNRYLEWKEKVGSQEAVLQNDAGAVKHEFSNEEFPALFQDYLAHHELPWSVPIKEAAGEMGMRKNDIKIEWIKNRLYRKKMSASALDIFDEE